MNNWSRWKGLRSRTLGPSDYGRLRVYVKFVLMFYNKDARKKFFLNVENVKNPFLTSRPTISTVRYEKIKKTLKRKNVVTSVISIAGYYQAVTGRQFDQKRLGHHRRHFRLLISS